MIGTDLQEIANAVVRKARQNGSIRASDIRAELARTKAPKEEWKQVVALSGPLLRYQHGRYYYQARATSPLEAEVQQQKAIHTTVSKLIRQYKKNHAQIERREQGRINFVQPVTVRTEDGRALTLLSRDLSKTGIRLIGASSLLGRRVEVEVVDSEAGKPARFVVRVLWTCAVGDGLFENGGTFLEMLDSTH